MSRLVLDVWPQVLMGHEMRSEELGLGLLWRGAGDVSLVVRKFERWLRWSMVAAFAGSAYLGPVAGV